MRTQLFVIAATASLVAGCASDRPGAVGESRDRAHEGGTGGAPACMAEQCFPIHMDKDISFVAVSAEGCFGGDVDLWLEVDGERLAIDPSPHGQGKPCGDLVIDPAALKFEGLGSTQDVDLCVAMSGTSMVGPIHVVTKAGQECASEDLGGDCAECTTSTTTTASATTGAGGGGGEGGAATTVTVGATATVGVTASASVGAGGAGGDDATVTVGVTTGGGEGGCGGESGEGGSSGDTSTVGVTASATVGAGGHGGAGEGGMGEGGVCVHETDTEVDAVE